MRVVALLFALLTIGAAPSWASVYAKVERSVVRMEIWSEHESIYRTFCSGVVVGSQLVLTEEHCLLGGITVERHAFSVVKRAESLALLRTVGRSSTWRTLPIRREVAGYGEPVAAIGFGFGGQQPVLTAGVVAGPNMHGAIAPSINDHLLLDINLISGQSGGAIVDREGRLVTVVSGVHTDGSGAPNALAVSVRQAVVRELLR